MIDARASTGEQESGALFIVCVFLVFAFSVYVRLGGISHSEPFLIQVDEPDFVRRAIVILATGDLNPGWFGHPGSFTIYNLALLYGGQALISGVPFEELLPLYEDNPAPFHILGKYLIAFWSMLGQLGLWFLARQFVGKWFALLAVLMLACAPLDIEYSTLIRTDTQQSALLVFMCLFLVQIVRSGSWAAFVGAGALLGLSVAVKWPSLVGCVSIVIASVLHFGLPRSWLPSREHAIKVAVAGVASIASAFVVAPFIFLSFRTVLANVAAEARSYHLSATSGGFIHSFLAYIQLLSENVAIPGIVLAVFGAGSAARSTSWREYCGVMSLFVVYLAFVCAQSLWWPRWAVPLLPILCLSSAIGAAHVFASIRKHLGKSRELVAMCLMGLVVAVPVFANVGNVLEERAADDNGVLATAWILNNIPKGSRILTEYDAPYLPRGMFDIFAVTADGMLARVEQKAKYFVAPWYSRIYLAKAEVDVSGFDYIVLGDIYDRINSEAAMYEREIGTYEELFKQTERVREFGRYKIMKVIKR